MKRKTEWKWKSESGQTEEQKKTEEKGKHPRKRKKVAEETTKDPRIPVSKREFHYDPDKQMYFTSLENGDTKRTKGGTKKSKSLCITLNRKRNDVAGLENSIHFFREENRIYLEGINISHQDAISLWQQEIGGIVHPKREETLAPELQPIVPVQNKTPDNAANLPSEIAVILDTLFAPNDIPLPEEITGSWVDWVMRDDTPPPILGATPPQSGTPSPNFETRLGAGHSGYGNGRGG